MWSNSENRTAFANQFNLTYTPQLVHMIHSAIGSHERVVTLMRCGIHSEFTPHPLWTETKASCTWAVWPRVSNPGTPPGRHRCSIQPPVSSLSKSISGWNTQQLKPAQGGYFTLKARTHALIFGRQLCYGDRLSVNLTVGMVLSTADFTFSSDKSWICRLTFLSGVNSTSDFCFISTVFIRKKL